MKRTTKERSKELIPQIKAKKIKSDNFTGTNNENEH